MTSKVSRAALIAAIAVGASGLVAGSAQAADTPYYVNAPAVTGVSNVTPESATLVGSVDTGGNPGTTFLFPADTAAGLTIPFGGGITIAGTNATLSLAGDEISIDGLPVSGSDSDVALTAGTGASTTTLGSFSDEYSNDGNDDYSDVVFEYDPIKDYIANGGTFGPETQYAPELDVPTTAGTSHVQVSVGAFGTAAQNSTGNTPLNPGTEYVYGITDQPGVTDDAETVNTVALSGTTTGAAVTASATGVNPTYSCYPTAYVAVSKYSTFTSTGTVSGGLVAAGGATQTTPQPEIQGPCQYIYGNVSGTDYYNSVAGTFSTPKLGTLNISKTAVVKGSGATLTVQNASGFKATGSLKLTTNSGGALGSAKLSIGANGTSKVTLRLTAAGKKDAKKKDSEKLVLTSNFGQTTSTKRVTL